ncbi:MAG: hypothetical protein II909_02570 [Kiritimatiellae bacterium]|nr:hypothetical protein [Kiritimatiellia bacterium]
MAKADVTSEIVGYQQITIPTGYSLFTVTFKDVGGDEYDIQDIKVLTTAGADYASNNKVKMQKLSVAGEYLTLYNYRLSKGGWCQGSTYVGTAAVTFADGEGVALYNGDASELKLQVSGAVNLTPVSTAIPTASYKIIGNPTPVSVDLQDVIPYLGENICSANNKVKVQKIGTDGEYGTLYNWRQSKGGWCQGSTFVGENVVTLAPGEGLAVYNGESEAVTLKFPSPISE